MKVYLVVTQLLYALTLPIWFVIWGLSFMAFDRGYDIGNITFVSVITAHPFAIIICAILAWKFRIKKPRFAIIINLVPLLWILPLFLI